jgi:ABC-type nickel/cobalt efflux system permease component RcnA
MADKLEKTSEGYSEGAEFRFLGNLFGALIASAGLLAGTMLREKSSDYWLEDIVPLLLLAITLRGLLKSAMELAKDSIYYEEQKKQVIEALSKQEAMAAAMAEGADRELPKIASKPKYSEEEVIEAVSKRIEQQREDAQKKNKSQP